MFRFGKQEEPATSFDPWDIVVGLTPSLVRDLAQWVGYAEDELLLPFQSLPWGDRAALAAYRVLELSATSEGSKRVARVLPIAVDVVNAAAQFLSEDHPYRLAATATSAQQPIGLTASATLPLVKFVSAESTDAAAIAPAIVEQVDRDESFTRLRVRVPVEAHLDDEGDLSESFDIVAFDTARPVVKGDRLGLVYYSNSVQLSRPQGICVLGIQAKSTAKTTAKTRSAALEH